MNYTITIADLEDKCLQYVTTNVSEYLANAMLVRATGAKAEIIQKNIAYCNENNIAIAVGEAAQVAQAFEIGSVQTIAEVNASRPVYNEAEGE